MQNYTEVYGKLKLRSGAGNGWQNGLCVMEAVAWLNGESATDRPNCACPVLGQFAINLNDTLNDENRQKLLPLALHLTFTRSKAHEKKRAEFLVIQVAKRVIAETFDAVKLNDIAEEYRQVETLADVKRVSVKAISSAYASNAANAANAATFAANSADAANDDDASYFAANAAYYAAYAADTMQQELLLKCIPILEEAIALGPNGKDELDRFKPRMVDLANFVEGALV